MAAPARGWRRFLLRHDHQQWARFQRFREENAFWLADYARYSVLRQRFLSGYWLSWPREFAHRDADALLKLQQESQDYLEVEQAIQFAFDEQWKALRAYCAERDIRFIGDVAIFVNYDSADVWTHPEIFELMKTSLPFALPACPRTISVRRVSDGATRSTSGMCWKAGALTGG